MSKYGNVFMKEIRGGEIVIGDDGTPTGYLKKQAGTYTCSFRDNERLFTVDMAIEIMADIEHHLLSEGYTMYIDGWSNMHFVSGTTYEIESRIDLDSAFTKARDAKKFASKHVLPNGIKIFMDGTVETGTGFVEPLYLDGNQGIANREEDELPELTRKANENGLTMRTVRLVEY